MSRSPALGSVVVVLIVGLAAAWRIPALFDDPWFDEVWSWGFARSVDGVGAIFRLAHDNNHYLNTLFIRLLGEQTHWWPYRLLSLVTGLAAIPVAMRIAARDGRPAAVATGLLFAFSYLMTVYGSEARGYAPATLCALTLVLLLDGGREDATTVVGVWAVTLLGFAAQLSFGFIYAAVLVWCAWRVIRAGDARGARLRAALAFHAVPVTIVGVFAAVVLRHMQIGGGITLSVVDVLRDTVTWTLGLPTVPAALAASGAALVLAVVARDVWLLRRRGSDLWVLDVVAILAPALLVAAVRPPQLYPRYFLMSVTILLVAIGRVLGDALGRGGATRVVATAILAAICVGNGVRLARFLADGRGRYADALRYVVAATPGDEVEVSADDDFDTLTMLNYYWPRVADGKRLRYFRHAEVPQTGTDWFLVRTYDPTADTRPTRKLAVDEDAPVVTYRLERVFPFDGGAAGWHWSVYRRVEP